ncbi:MAG: ATP-grasp fold amidoligase family protein [Oscillospiraceae bacterium]
MINIKKKMLNLLPDSIYLKLLYYRMIGKKLNLNNPQTFNEKLQWLKLHDRDPQHTIMADKFAVREFIKNTIGEEYLIPLIGVWDNFDDIDFDKLPNEFVLKPNHTSGDIFICENKSQINIEELRHQVEAWMKREYFWVNREWPYKNIKPLIIAEKYMKSKLDHDIKDYKIMVFNGEAKCAFVCSNRSRKNGLNVTFFDMEWNVMPFERHYPKDKNKIQKPENFKKMIELAEFLSKDNIFSRIDFYEIDNQLYFGEITFYPGSGFEEFSPSEYDLLLGSWISLPIDRK